VILCEKCKEPLLHCSLSQFSLVSESGFGFRVRLLHAIALVKLSPFWPLFRSRPTYLFSLFADSFETVLEFQACFAFKSSPFSAGRLSFRQNQNNKGNSESVKPATVLYGAGLPEYAIF